MDSLEDIFVEQLTVIQKVPPGEGCIPGTTITLAEHQAALIAKIYTDLQSYRRTRMIARQCTPGSFERVV